MPKTLRYICRVCNATISFRITEDMERRIKEQATYYPFPVIHYHGEGEERHAAVLHLDEELNNRGTEATGCIFEGE
ncbi:MAG: hypothetical protein Kow0069_18160 [Promethearchaeota archaeon]